VLCGLGIYFFLRHCVAWSICGFSQGEVTQTDVASTAELLVGSKSVVIVPGYGLAVAKGQYPLAELVKTLTSRSVSSIIPHTMMRG
jgi:NAD/NADP transhydrogenase beta subunit